MRLSHRIHRAVSLVIVLAPLAGCGDDPPPPPVAPPPAPKVAPKPPPPPSYYDEEGRLKESGERAGGVPIPVAFEAVPVTEKRHYVYRTTKIPLDKVIGFFGPRLFTGQIDRVGAGLVYREARPMDRRDQKTTVDVRIMPTGPEEVTVRIQQRGLPPLVPPDVADLEKALREEQKRVE